MKSPAPKILVINPGSTSTKIAVFRGRRAVFERELKHPAKSLGRFDSVLAQLDFRRRAILRVLKSEGVALAEIDVFVGRGGVLRPVDGGTYKVNDRMLADLSSARYGEHASNLGAILADGFARPAGKDAYIADPVVVDELSDVTRISGHPEMPRRTLFHALNQKASAREVAGRIGKAYEKCNLIVAHIGGGVSVGAHRRGRIIDGHNAIDGAGPFTPQRTGALELMAFYKYARAHRLTVAQAQKFITRSGGLQAHLGTNDCKAIEQRIAAGDKKAALVYDAFIYKIARDIGAAAAGLSGKVDAVVLTGGVVRAPRFRRKLRRMIRFIAPVYVLIANGEMEALAAAALEAFTGIKKAKVY